MTQKKNETFKRAYKTALAALTVVVGVLFVVQVWRVFALGNRPFTVENISKYFSQIAFFVWLWIAATIVGGVLWLAFPSEKSSIVACVSPQVTLAKLKRRLPDTDGEGRKERSKRIAVWLACAAICIVCAVVALVYLTGEYAAKAQEGFFSEHGEAERLLRALPWILAAFGACIGALYYQSYSYKKEITLVKTQISENAKQGIKAVPVAEKAGLWDKLCGKMPFLKSKWFMIGVRAALGVLGLILIVVGINGGGMADVLEKAINICTQCIGLG